MENKSTPEAQNQAPKAVEPEVLQPRANDGSPATGSVPALGTNPAPATSLKARRRTFRPSHKGTFIGLTVVLAILAVNVIVLSLVLKSKSNNSNNDSGQVTISKSVLNKVGINSESVGDSGIVFEVRPNAEFGGAITIAGALNVGGALNLNNTFNATAANLTQLEAGTTTTSQLTVNGNIGVSGNTTLASATIKNSLIVAGLTQLQGDVTVANLTASGNLSVQGTFSTNTFSANNIVSNDSLIINGHIVTSGSLPTVSYGGTALGTNGTTAVSGNDSAGTINIDIGTGATDGTLVNLTFHTVYTIKPQVVISAVNIPVTSSCDFYIFNLSVNGFSVEDTCALPPGGYSIDYVAIQ